MKQRGWMTKTGLKDAVHQAHCIIVDDEEGVDECNPVTIMYALQNKDFPDYTWSFQAGTLIIEKEVKDAGNSQAKV